MAKMKKDREQPKETKTRPSSNRNKLIALGIIAAAIAGVAYVTYRSDNTIDTNVASIGDIPCETQEYVTYHIHSHMDIFVNGQHVPIPGLIGIKSNECLYWLHTHTTDGIIHMESPKERDFTIGQFFDIWKSTNSGYPTTSDPEIFVNGNLVNTSMDKTVMKAHDEIVIVYGGVPQNMPTFYQFPEGD